jgi:hypothetical protein
MAIQMGIQDDVVFPAPFLPGGSCFSRLALWTGWQNALQCVHAPMASMASMASKSAMVDGKQPALSWTPRATAQLDQSPIVRVPHLW